MDELENAVTQYLRAKDEEDKIKAALDHFGGIIRKHAIRNACDEKCFTADVVMKAATGQSLTVVVRAVNNAGRKFDTDEVVAEFSELEPLIVTTRETKEVTRVDVDRLNRMIPDICSDNNGEVMEEKVFKLRKLLNLAEATIKRGR